MEKILVPKIMQKALGISPFIILVALLTGGKLAGANSTEAEILREVLDNTFLWVFNRHTWTPKEYKNAGVYVVHDPKAVGSSEYEDLEDLLSGGTSERGVRFSKNRLVRFAPYGTFREIRRHKDLTQHGMVIAGYDIDGAENLVEVSKALKKMPHLFLSSTLRSEISTLQ